MKKKIIAERLAPDVPNGKVSQVIGTPSIYSTVSFIIRSNVFNYQTTFSACQIPFSSAIALFLYVSFVWVDDNDHRELP